MAVTWSFPLTGVRNGARTDARHECAEMAYLAAIGLTAGLSARLESVPRAESADGLLELFAEVVETIRF